MLGLASNEGLGVFGGGMMTQSIQWNWQVATFWVGCFVMAVNLVTAAVNWQIFERQKAIRERIALLEQRVAAFADMQGSHTTQPPTQKAQQ